MPLSVQIPIPNLVLPDEIDARISVLGGSTAALKEETLGEFELVVNTDKKTIEYGDGDGGRVSIQSGQKNASSVEGFAHTLTYAEWRKAAKFTSTNTTAILATTVRSTTGYVIILNFDGTWGSTGQTTKNATAKVGNGNAANNILVTSKAPTSPFDTLVPKFYAILPCDAGGTVTGDLTHLHLSYNQLTSFDATGLSSLEYLHLSYNQLTSFDATGLSSLTLLDLSSNQLTSFDETGLSSLTLLDLSSNQLASFAGTGLSSLTNLDLSNNQLTSFDETGLTSLTILDLSNNQLTSILLPEFDGIQPFIWATYALDLTGNLLTTDGLYLLLDSVPVATHQPYPLSITGCPADDTVTAGPNIVDGATYTAAQVQALLTTKGYSLQVTGGTIAP